MQNFTPLIYFIYIYINLFNIWRRRWWRKMVQSMTVLVTYYVIIFIPRLNGRQQLNSAERLETLSPCNRFGYRAVTKRFWNIDRGELTKQIRTKLKNYFGILVGLSPPKLLILVFRILDQYQYLGNSPPTPLLTQQQSMDNKIRLMLG